MAMADAPNEPDLTGQQVMTAQVTEATPLSRGVGQSTLEGRVARTGLRQATVPTTTATPMG